MPKMRSLPPEAGVALVFVLIVTFFSWRAPDFATWANIRLLTKQSAELMLVSLGMTFVIATGGIDLSVGSLLGLSGMVLGIVLLHGGSTIIACLAALGVGLLVGALHVPVCHLYWSPWRAMPLPEPVLRWSTTVGAFQQSPSP
jgi:ribose/xylose/arabinose/galactoside ABC-type transport system permease subunit